MGGKYKMTKSQNIGTCFKKCKQLQVYDTYIVVLLHKGGKELYWNFLISWDIKKYLSFTQDAPLTEKRDAKINFFNKQSHNFVTDMTCMTIQRVTCAQIPLSETSKTF